MARKKKETNKPVVKTEVVKEQPKVKQPPKQELEFCWQYLISGDTHINTRRGILGPDNEVSEHDFPGGLDTLNEHVAAGVLVRRKIFNG